MSNKRNKLLKMKTACEITNEDIVEITDDELALIKI